MVVGLVVTGSFMLAACNGSTATKSGPALAMTASDRPATTAAAADPGQYKIGRPYKVAGTWYTPQEDPDYDATGRASWYGPKFHGKRTANGERFDMASLTGAHPTLPLPSYARVTNLENGRSVVVRINDRGPFAHDRVIDVSAKAAEVLDFKRDGAADVRVQFVGLAPVDGDDAWLTTTVRNDGQAVAPTMVASLDRPDTEPQPGQQAAAAQPTASSLAWIEGPKPAAETTPQPRLALVSGYRDDQGGNALDATFALFDRRAAIALPNFGG